MRNNLLIRLFGIISLAWFNVLILCASLNTQLVIEVRPTVGSSTNGGGFWSGATGTDMTPYNNKNAAGCTNCQSSTVNISTTDAVSNGTTTLTSAAGNFSSALVGGIVYFAGGSGSITAVRRQVISVTNATTIVLDASIASSTGMTMNIGGALDDPRTALLFNTASNRIWVKNTGTLVYTANLVLNNNIQPSRTIPYNMLLSYNTTRGDCWLPQSCAGRTTIQASTTSGLFLIDSTGGGSGGWLVSGFTIDCNGVTNCSGFDSNQYDIVYNNRVINFTSFCVRATGGGSNNGELIWSNECTGGTSTCASTSTAGIGSIHTAAKADVAYNWVHDNACNGIATTQDSWIHDNLITNLTGCNAGGGVTCFGITISNTSAHIEHNTIYATGSDGIDAPDILQGTIRNNLIVNAGRYGINGPRSGATCGQAALPTLDGNAFLNSATANRHCMDDTGTVNPIDAFAPYTNVIDVALTVSPFVNAAGNDFRLNGTAGGGAAATGTGWPGTFLSNAHVGSMSFGALQPLPATAATPASAYVQ